MECSRWVGLSGRGRAARLAAAEPTEASTCSGRTARLTADVLALVVGPKRQERRAALHLEMHREAGVGGRAFMRP